MLSILKKMLLILFTVVPIVLSGCVSTTETTLETRIFSTESHPATLPPGFSGTSVPSTTPQPTYTPQATSTATVTRTPAATATPQIDTRLTTKCVAMQDSLNSVPDSVIAFQGEFVRFGKLAILDLTNNQTTWIVGDDGYISTIVVSPDFRQLAYIDIRQHILHIIDATGKDIESIPVIENWYSVIQWVDQDHLLIENIPLFPDGMLNPPASSVLFNLSTNEQEAEYPHGYPGQFYIGNGAPGWGPYYFSQSVFDSSFSRVVYPAYEDIGGALVLRDIEKREEIAHFWVGDPDFGGLPA